MSAFPFSRRPLRFLCVAIVAVGAVCAHGNLIAHVSRDYLGNVPATDRFWFYKNLDGSPRTSGGGVYPALEYVYNRSENFHVVSVRANTIVVVLRFSDPQPFSWVVGNFVVNGARLRIPPAGTTDPEVVLPLSASVSGTLSLAPEGGTGEVTLTLSNVPCVARGNLEIDANVEGATQYWTTGGYQVWERIYVADAYPKGLQTVPWTDLLEYACAWAKLETGESNVARAATFGLFWNSPWVYYTGAPQFWVDANPVNETPCSYKLKEALHAPGDIMECRDASGFLNLAIAALGYETSNRRLRNLADAQNIFPYWGIATNLVCPMGSNAAVDEHPITGKPTYRVFEFGYHQVVTTDYGTYDATLAHRLDPSGGSYRNPPANWVLSYYWQTPWVWGFLGLVYGPYTIHSTDPQAVGVHQDIKVLEVIQ